MAQDSERAGACGAIVDLDGHALADERSQDSWTSSGHLKKQK
jgi:hypothetical protein